MAMTRIVYFSEFDPETFSGSITKLLNDILDASNHNNGPKGITGVLVFDSAWFVQVLEGERDVVCSTFESIQRDERHFNVSLVEMATISDRLFGSWSMGYAARTVLTAPLFEPYLHQGRLKPPVMSGHEILALLTTLAKTGLARAATPV